MGKESLYNDLHAIQWQLSKIVLTTLHFFVYLKGKNVKTEGEM